MLRGEFPLRATRDCEENRGREDSRCPIAERRRPCWSPWQRASWASAPWLRSRPRRLQAGSSSRCRRATRRCRRSPTYPFGLRHTGTFTSSAPFCRFGHLAGHPGPRRSVEPHSGEASVHMRRRLGDSDLLRGRSGARTRLHRYLEHRRGNRALCRPARAGPVPRGDLERQSLSTSEAWSSARAGRESQTSTPSRRRSP